MLRNTSVNGKGGYSISGLTGNLSLRNAKVGRGKIGSHYENVTLGDMIWVLAHLSYDKSKQHAFGAGWLGWFQGYINATSSEKLVISPGLSLCDYIYGSKVSTEISPGVFSNEPYGYFFAAGPAVRVSYLINQSFWIDGSATLDIPYASIKKMGTYSFDAQEEKDYPVPFFSTLSVTVFHKSKLFFSTRWAQGIDRGGNGGNATRFDISLGYQFLN